MTRFFAGLFGLFALAVFTASALAQFGPLFGDPPRPPANIPNRPDVPQAPQVAPPNVPPANVPPPNPVQPRDDVQSQPLPPPPAANQLPPSQRQQLPPPPQAPTVQLPPGQPPSAQAPMPPPPPSDDVVPEPPTPKIANPTAVFSGLDKITGRIITFDVAIDETVRFGALEVTPRVCYTRPPTELPQTDGFVEVDELTLQGELRRIFTGWMFAASPGLNAVEHPIYDIWLTDCKGGGPPPVTVEAPPNEPAAPPKPPPRQRPPARTQAQPQLAPPPPAR